jgi:hypothetical protein
VTARVPPAGKRSIAQADLLPAQPSDQGRRRRASAARAPATLRYKAPVLPSDLDGLPRPPALQQNPELALLAVLHTTLETLVLSLVAFYPHLATPDPPPDRETLAAHRLMVSAWHFQHRLTRYCRDLAARCAPSAPPVPSPDDALF